MSCVVLERGTMLMTQVTPRQHAVLYVFLEGKAGVPKLCQKMVLGGEMVFH